MESTQLRLGEMHNVVRDSPGLAGFNAFLGNVGVAIDDSTLEATLEENRVSPVFSENIPAAIREQVSTVVANVLDARR
jgi:hypothetical protein